MKKHLALSAALMMGIMLTNAQTTGSGNNQNTNSGSNQKSGTNTKKANNKNTNSTKNTDASSGTNSGTGTTPGSGTGTTPGSTSGPGTTGGTGSGSGSTQGSATDATQGTGTGPGSTGGSGTGSGTTGAGSAGTGGTGTGQTTGGMSQGQGDAGGQMTSTARYAGMGVKMGSLHRKDMKFVMTANSSNMMELQLSQLAAQRATSPAVKDFANMMVQHHSMAGQEMKQMLSGKGAVIPDTAMLSKHRVRMEMLQNLQGADFDKAYMRVMVDAHEDDLDEFEDETTDARDTDVRAFAAKMLPTLRQHYTHAKAVRKQL